MTTANPRLVLLIAGALLAGAAHAQTTWRVSVSSSGAQSDGPSSDQRISGDGRHVVFQSFASNLVAGDTNDLPDVFVHELETGATTLVSVSTSGAQGNHWSYARGTSADGRFVVFDSHATNLVSPDTNAGTDVFVRDRSTGVTSRASVASNGDQGNAYSGYASISADGRFVAFISGATNLVAGDTNGWNDVFRHDRLTGETRRVSVRSDGAQGNLHSGRPSISSDGRFVAFESEASNFVTGDGNGGFDVFVHDTATGTTTCVSTTSSGVPGNADSEYCSISADGRYVSFTSLSSNLVAGDTNANADVFVRDRLLSRTLRASTSSAGLQGNSFAFLASVSGDGSCTVFSSPATNLVGGDVNGRFDVFVHDAITGITELASIDSAGVQGNSESGVDHTSHVSTGGRYVFFTSRAANLVPGDTNSAMDVFVHDRFGHDPSALFCSGDGSATACPCSNPGEPWRGCANSVSAAGALLLSSGSASLSADTLRLDASGLPATSGVLFFQGPTALQGGLATTIGKGLRCTGGQLRRLGRKLSSGGSSSLGPTVGDAPISVLGQIPPGGGTFHYQALYRNVEAPFCSAPGTNTTNGLSVAWGP